MAEFGIAVQGMALLIWKRTESINPTSVDEKTQPAESKAQFFHYQSSKPPQVFIKALPINADINLISVYTANKITHLN